MTNKIKKDRWQLIIAVGNETKSIWRILEKVTGKKSNKYNIKGMDKNGSCIANVRHLWHLKKKKCTWNTNITKYALRTSINIIYF